MLSLFLSILFFSTILILFKVFEKFHVDNLQAIIINYAVAGSLGLLLYDKEIYLSDIFNAPWMYYAALVGLFFVTVFKVLADATQKVGIAISTIANKMSVLLPITASFFLYGDSVTWTKITGIAIAIFGVFLSSSKKGKLSFDPSYLWLIIFIFIGQGVADIFFNYAQATYVSTAEAPLFISMIFISAFFIGLIVFAIRWMGKKETPKWKNIPWGIAIGIPNFLTIYYFFKTLDSDFMESSEIYPILNMGVIVLTAIGGLLLFKERLTTLNWVGIIFCVISIGLISY